VIAVSVNHARILEPVVLASSVFLKPFSFRAIDRGIERLNLPASPFKANTNRFGKMFKFSHVVLLAQEIDDFFDGPDVAGDASLHISLKPLATEAGLAVQPFA
jgi:hypothetical protein